MPSSIGKTVSDVRRGCIRPGMSTEAILTALADAGAMERVDLLTAVSMHERSFANALSLLKEAGLIRSAYLITPTGLDILRRHEAQRNGRTCA